LGDRHGRRSPLSYGTRWTAISRFAQQELSTERRVNRALDIDSSFSGNHRGRHKVLTKKGRLTVVVSLRRGILL